jgi:hypothetical protein
VKLSVAVLFTALAACGDDDGGPNAGPESHDDAGAERDAGPHGGAGHSGGGRDGGASGNGGDDGGTADAGISEDAGGGDAGLPFGGLVPDTAFEAQDIDLFGVPGHRFWVEISDEQVVRMNGSSYGGPGPIADGLGQVLAAGDPLYEQLARDGFFPGVEGDIYTPGDPHTFADHVVVQDADTGSIADYGKVEVKLVGESTGRSLDFAHIPNLKLDTDEFEMDKRIGDFEHIRLNNGLVGSIFRETIAHRVYAALGYPALRASWAFLGTNVWGPDTWVPMVLVEVYKRKFCHHNAELLGGDCENMWEFPGNVGGELGNQVPDSACQVSECDNTRLEQLIDRVASTPAGAGYKEALADLVDWDRFHQFQCLSWMMWTGDDPIHNGNNNLIIERDDGKLIWAPYSIDISAGQDWYTNVPLTGSSPMAIGCQADPACWADTIAACEELIPRFDALDPESLVDEAVATLTELGMMREGDEQRAEDLRAWYVERQTQLPEELERYRYLPDEFGNCPEGLQLCGDGGCGTEEQCIERSCPLGQRWCDSRQMCIGQYEACTNCPEDRPLYCYLSSTCVPTQEDCWATCEATPGFTYCAVFNSCVEVGTCPDDDDGGIIIDPWP